MGKKVDGMELIKYITNQPPEQVAMFVLDILIVLKKLANKLEDFGVYDEFESKITNMGEKNILSIISNMIIKEE